ncbi:MAG TPA: hypothetical protein VKB80_22155, partial [Kofleriaceae bacterium]|nr:hypothetical protein [Kofleriaceae bacterium]
MTKDVARRPRAAWLGSALLAAAALALPQRDAGAGATARWSVDSYEEWDEGDAESAFITSVGAV